MIQEGKHVKLNYTLTVNGEMVESTKEKPFEYTHGQDDIIPAFKNELEGLKAGDEKKIVLEPNQAYGNEDPQAFKEIPRSQLPQETKPEPGMKLQVTTSEGKNLTASISGVKDDSVILNFNHPLAGKTLTFDVKVLEVN